MPPSLIGDEGFGWLLAWVFDQVLDDLLLVGANALEGYMDPMMGTGWGGLFPDQLMVRDVVHKPYKPTLAGGFIWDVNVGCFTGLVL